MGSQNPTMASDVDGLTQNAGSTLRVESKNPAQTIEEDGAGNANPAPAFKRDQTTCGIPPVKSTSIPALPTVSAQKLLHRLRSNE